MLFTREKLKLRDKGGSTKDKSEGYTAVSLRLDPDNALAFGLSFPYALHALTMNVSASRPFTSFVWSRGKKGITNTYQLVAPMAGVRDLIALTLQAFAEPATLDKIPVTLASSDQPMRFPHARAA